jgi:hypothetical protein
VVLRPAENKAGNGVADYLMLRRKLPDEIFAGRRTMPDSLFGRDDVASYLSYLRRALDQTVTELGSDGSVNLFDLTRRLGHRLGRRRGRVRDRPKKMPSNGWCRHSTRWTAPTRSSTRMRWPRSPRRTSGPSGRR